MSWRKQITVELLDHMGSDESIANAARVSFSGHGDWDQLPHGYSPQRMARLVRYLAEHKHMVPFRHPTITLRCRVPIWLSRQLAKHQTGLSWSEVSRRYVKDTPELFNQEFRAAPDGSIKQGSAEVVDPLAVPVVPVASCGTRIELLCERLIEWYDACVDTGIAPETLRGYLPQNMMTEFVWTGSLLAFAHMVNLRDDAHAQVEAQHFAGLVDGVIRPLFPVAWPALRGDAQKATG